jgi:hypothetical protein
LESQQQKTICFDLDGTLCTNTFGEYEQAEPFSWAIERVNELARAGHRIVVFTARGTATGIDWERVTRAQLDRWGVEYHDLRFGKPSADVYVDDRGVHTHAWRCGDISGVPGFPRQGGSAEEPELPTTTAPHLSSVAEVGRTFGGEPVEVARHAAHALGRARAAGVRPLPRPAAIEEAVHAALQAVPATGADLVFTISLTDAGHAAFADAPEPAPIPGLHIACRRLGQVAQGVRELVPSGAQEARSLGVAAGTGSSSSRGREWPLWIDDEGFVTDLMGGELAMVASEGLVVDASGTARSVALARLAEIAHEVGLELCDRRLSAAELAGTREAFLVGFPFCILPLAALDGQELDHPLPGPVASELLDAWSRAVGIDIAAQTTSLLYGEAPGASRRPALRGG